MARRIELFSAGRPLCVSDETPVREAAGDHQEVVVRDVRTDHAGSDRHELAAVGVSQPPG